MELYHEENLSLAEIADEFGISRQGVHDALHKAEKSLEAYEEKLGLVEKFSRTSDAVSDIERRINKLAKKAENKADDGFASELAEINKIIEELEM